MEPYQEQVYTGTVVFDAVDGTNVAVPEARLTVRRKSFLVEWSWWGWMVRNDIYPSQPEGVTRMYPFAPAMKQRGILAAFAPDGSPLFEAMARPYSQSKGYAWFYRYRARGKKGNHDRHPD